MEIYPSHLQLGYTGHTEGKRVLHASEIAAYQNEQWDEGHFFNEAHFSSY
jgi:hypothetical protein